VLKRFSVLFHVCRSRAEMKRFRRLEAEFVLLFCFGYILTVRAPLHYRVAQKTGTLRFARFNFLKY